MIKIEVVETETKFIFQFTKTCKPSLNTINFKHFDSAIEFHPCGDIITSSCEEL